MDLSGVYVEPHGVDVQPEVAEVLVEEAVGGRVLGLDEGVNLTNHTCTSRRDF